MINNRDLKNALAGKSGADKGEGDEIINLVEPDLFYSDQKKALSLKMSPGRGYEAGRTHRTVMTLKILT